VVATGSRIETGDIIHQQFRSTETPTRDFTWKAAERKHIMEVLSHCDGNKSYAARELGISRRYLHYKLKEWGQVSDNDDLSA
jgi:Nif-specific regulatory protein